MTVLPPADDDRAGCAARQERIAELEDLAEELREAAGAQSDQIAARREQVAKLELILSRDSGNNAIQPSGDDTPCRVGEEAAADREAEPGKRPGAPATAMGWDVSDNTVDYYGPGSALAAGTWWGERP